MLIKKGNETMIKYVLMLTVACVFGLAGCDDDVEEPDSDETAGEEIEEAAEETGDAIEEGADEAEDEVDEEM